MICANYVSGNEIGFNSDYNKLTIITANGQLTELDKASKKSLAIQLIHLISEQLPNINKGN